MNALTGGLVALALLISLLGAEMIVWPELPQSGFVSGRVATKADIEAGNAVFSMEGASEGPVEIAIPQYALWTDEDGMRHPVVVIQAERSPYGTEIFGAKTLDGTYLAGTLPELELLGQEKPKAK